MRWQGRRGSRNIEDRRGIRGGGGVSAVGGSLTIVDSVISDNVSVDASGGIGIQGGTTASVTNSFITGNTSQSRGAGGIALTHGVVVGHGPGRA